MSISSMLNKTITVQRPVITKDTSGGSIRTYAALSGVTNVPAAIQPLNDMERQKYAARQIYQSHIIFVDQDYDLKKQDLVVDSTGIKYVVESFQDEGGRGRVWTIHVLEQT